MSKLRERAQQWPFAMDIGHRLRTGYGVIVLFCSMYWGIGLRCPWCEAELKRQQAGAGK